MAATLPNPNSCCTLCDGQTVVIDTSGSSGGGTGSGAVVAQTLAALRAVSTSSFTTQTIAYLLGNAAVYDFGPAKTYWFDAGSNDLDNPFSIIQPNDRMGSPGRWVQVM